MSNIPKPVYVMSEPHLSGYRVILGYNTLEDASQAHDAAVNALPELLALREEVAHLRAALRSEASKAYAAGWNARAALKETGQ